MSESGSGDDRGRLGRESDVPGRSERPNPESDHQRERTDTGASHQQSQSQGYGNAPVQQKRGKGWAIAGIICGVLSILILPVILGPVGIILGIVGLVKGSRGLGIAAIVVSVVCMIIGIIVGALLFTMFSNGQM